MQKEANPRVFVRSQLPWIIAGAVFVLYLVTLNHWVNLRSLPMVSRAAGWDFALPLQGPVFYLITFPFRLLPSAIQPVALNVFSALCAALSLGFLARSVALLPHDRTHEQRLRERSEFSLLSIPLAWAPPVIAALVCGLQLTFWEHATALTGEMLDLLIFAYLIRCLLEFRISHKDHWLYQFALLYGVGVTNNWALIGFFPLFLAAVIWIKGLRFFDGPFLIRMSLLGLAGLLFYLVLPIAWQFSGMADASFFEVLKATLASQKAYLVNTPQLRNRALLLGLTAVLPIILIGIRWPSSFGDTSAAGASLTNLAFRVIHLFFLAAWLWIVFDPKYSPRELGLGVPFLTFYYLGALALGYYSGYALLVFTSLPRKSQWMRENLLMKALNPVIRIAVLAAGLAVPIALLAKNYPAIRASNGDILRDFTAQLADSLPKDTRYVLSEDPNKIALLRAHYAKTAPEGRPILVNARLLENPEYHFAMQKRHAEQWPNIGKREEIGARLEQDLVQYLVTSMAASNTVAYLHPSFGYFFETLYPEPLGQVYRLHLFTPDQVLPPDLNTEQIDRNEKFWNDLRQSGKLETVPGRQPTPDHAYVAENYSRALNTWGVFLQRSEKMEAAGPRFQQAHNLNTNNLAAELNLDFNRSHQAGEPGKHTLKAFQEIFPGWNSLLAEGGYIDHPEFCLLLGETFFSQQLLRQAAQQFSRVRALRPDDFRGRLGFAKALVYGNWVDKGLEEIAKIRSEVSLSSTNTLELLGLEAAAYFQKNDMEKAEALLKQGQPALGPALFDLYEMTGQITNAVNLLDTQIQQNPTNAFFRLRKAELLINAEKFPEAQASLDRVLVDHPTLPEALLLQTYAYIQQNQLDEALRVVNRVLERNSDNVQARVYRGIIHMQRKEFNLASEDFEWVLEEQPANLTALRNRAILNLRRDRLADAKQDYQRLQKIIPRSHSVYYGLGEVAYRQKDYASALNHYQTYLKYAPRQGGKVLEEEKEMVRQRVAELEAKR